MNLSNKRKKIHFFFELTEILLNSILKYQILNIIKNLK